MNERFPVKCLKLRKLAEIPRADYMGAAPPANLERPSVREAFLKMLRRPPEPAPVSNARPTWQTYSFNVAAWLRLPDAVDQSISLVLDYQDAQGHFGLLVDEARISGHSAVMLTGTVIFRTLGVPQGLYISCIGMPPEQTFILDELFVQRLFSEQVPAQRQQA